MRWVYALKWTDVLDYGLGIVKYVFLAGLAFFMLYLIGLLRRSAD